MMIKHRLRELTKLYGSKFDPEKSGELKRTKTDIENNLTRTAKLITNEDQSKKDGNSRKEKELVVLVEDFYNQYQSLRSLYGRLTGEYVKAAPCRSERVRSMSSSSSESEYFSSEEVDGRIEVNVSNQKPFSRERERLTLANITQEIVLRTQPSNKAKDFQDQLTTQAKALESLNRHKLHARVLELELLLKESKETVSVLQKKLKNNEDQAASKISELKARINKLEQEAKSLRTQKGKMEEKMKRNRNEALSQKKELTDQLNVEQQNLDSVRNRNKELESQLEREREKVSQYLVRIENLEKSLDETTSFKKNMLKEKDFFLARINDLELEVESRCSKQNYLEEQLRDTRSETNRLAEEGKTLLDRNHELERAMAQKEEEISVLLGEHESCKNGAFIQAMTLTAEVDNQRLQLDTLQDQKTKLELHNEQSQKQYAESLAQMENLNAKLETRVADHEETIKKLTETIEQISVENKQAKIWSNKYNFYQQSTEKKMEELAEEFRKNMEDNIRLLHQRIHIAEQLNNENKDSFKRTKQRHEQEKKMLGERIASYEDKLRTVKGTPPQIEFNLSRLEYAAGKLEEHREYVLGLVSKMLCEVQFAKDWIRERNGEMKQLKDKVDHLTLLLSDKEKQELLLREKVWKLEAKVSKEGGEKLNLIWAVNKLERKVGKLEKNLKDKNEELVVLGEKKKEAIRQLCFLIEFHRDRCVYLMDLMSVRKIGNRK